MILPPQSKPAPERDTRPCPRRGETMYRCADDVMRPLTAVVYGRIETMRQRQLLRRLDCR